MSDSLQSHGLWPTRLLLCPRDSPGKNTGVGCHSLLQGIFLTQGSKPGFLHCRQILYCLSHLGSPAEVYGKRQFVLDRIHLPCSLTSRRGTDMQISMYRIEWLWQSIRVFTRKHHREAKIQVHGWRDPSRIWKEELASLDVGFWRQGLPKWHSSSAQSLAYRGHLIKSFFFFFLMKRVRRDISARRQRPRKKSIKWTNGSMNEWAVCQGNTNASLKERLNDQTPKDKTNSLQRTFSPSYGSLPHTPYYLKGELRTIPLDSLTSWFF